MSADDNEASFHSLVPEITIAVHTVESPSTSILAEDLEQYCSPSQYPLENIDGFLELNQLPLSPTERRNSTGEWEHSVLNTDCLEDLENARLTTPVSRLPLNIIGPSLRETVNSAHASSSPSTDKVVVASSCSSIYLSVQDSSSSSYSSSSNQPVTEQKVTCTTLKDNEDRALSPKVEQRASQPPLPVCYQSIPSLMSDSSETALTYVARNGQSSTKISRMHHSIQPELPKSNSRVKYDDIYASMEYNNGSDVEIVNIFNSDLHEAPLRYFQMSSLERGKQHQGHSPGTASTDEETDWLEPEEQYASLQSSQSSVDGGIRAELFGRHHLKPSMDADYFRDKPRGEPMGSECELAAPVTNTSVSDRLKFIRLSTNKHLSSEESMEPEFSNGSSDSDDARNMAFVAPGHSSVLRSSWLRDCIEGADSVEDQQQAKGGTTNASAMPLSSHRYVSVDEPLLTDECSIVVDNEGNVRPPLVGQSEDGIATNLQFPPQTTSISLEDNELVANVRGISDEEMPSKTSISTSSTSKDSLAARVSSLLKATIQNISGAKVISNELKRGKTLLGPSPPEGQVFEKDVSRQRITCTAREPNYRESSGGKIQRSSESGTYTEAGSGRTEPSMDCNLEIEVNEHATDALYQVLNASDKSCDAVPQNITSLHQKGQFSAHPGYHLVSIIDDSKASLLSEPSSLDQAASKTDCTADQRTSSPSVMSVSSVASSKRLEWDSGADVGYGGPKVMYGLSTLERMAIGSCCSAIKRMEPEGKSSLVKDNPISQTTNILPLQPSQLTDAATDVAKLEDSMEPGEAPASISDLDCDSDIINMTYVIESETVRPLGQELAKQRLVSSESSIAESEHNLTEDVAFIDQHQRKPEKRETFEMLELALPENGEMTTDKSVKNGIVFLKNKGIRSSSLTDLTDAMFPKERSHSMPVRKNKYSSSISDILDGKCVVKQRVGNLGSLPSPGSVLSSQSSKTLVGLPPSAEMKVAPTPNPFCSTAIHDSVSNFLRQRLSFHTPSFNEVSSAGTVTPRIGHSTFTVSDPSSQSHLQQETPLSSGETQKIIGTTTVPTATTTSSPLKVNSVTSHLKLPEIKPGTCITEQQSTKKKSEMESALPQVNQKSNHAISMLKDLSVQSKNTIGTYISDAKHRDYLVSFTKDFVTKLCPASDIKRQQRLLSKILEDFGIASCDSDDGTNHQTLSGPSKEMCSSELHILSSHSSNMDNTTEMLNRTLPQKKIYATPSEKYARAVEIPGSFKMLKSQGNIADSVGSAEVMNEKPQSIAILKPYSPANSNVVFYAPVSVQDLGNILVGHISNNYGMRQSSTVGFDTILDAGKLNSATDSSLRNVEVVDGSTGHCNVQSQMFAANEKLNSVNSKDRTSNEKLCKEQLQKASVEFNSSCHDIHNDEPSPGFLSSGSVISNSTLLERLPINGGSESTLESSKERPTDIGGALFVPHSAELHEGPDDALFNKSSFGGHLSSVCSLVDSSERISRKLWPDGQQFREKVFPRLSSQMYTNSSASAVNESSSRHRRSNYAYHSVQQRISYTSESSSKDTTDRSNQNMSSYSSSRRIIQKLRTMDSIHPEGLVLVKELIRQQRKNYIKKLQKEVLWLERIEAILHGSEVNYNVMHEYEGSRSSSAKNSVRSTNQHVSPKRTRNKKSDHNSDNTLLFAKSKVMRDGSLGSALRKRFTTVPLKKSVQKTKDFGQSFPTPVPTDVETAKQVSGIELQRLLSVGVQTSFEFLEGPIDLSGRTSRHLSVIGKERPVISIPLMLSKKVQNRDEDPYQKSAMFLHKSSNKCKSSCSRKPTPVAKLSSDKHKRKPVAWFFPWDDAVPRRTQLQTSCGRVCKASADGLQPGSFYKSQAESVEVDHFQSLQEAFRMKKSDVINKMTSRQQKIQLMAEKRKNVHHQKYYINTRLYKSRPRKFTVPLSISSQHHNPQNRHLTHNEMREQTEKVYQGLAEVADKKKVQKREDVYKTNRLMAQIFKKKLQQKVLKGQISMQNTKKMPLNVDSLQIK